MSKADRPEIETIELAGVRAERPCGQQYANDTDYGKKAYVVGFDNHSSTGILVIADSEDGAVDEAADYADEMGYEGYFLDAKDEKEQLELDLEDEDEDVMYVGNYGRPVRGSELWMRKVNKDNVPPARACKRK